jgi:serine/threonine-protein kinase
MAPEQARGLWGEVDGRTDLWAVGATMFALLAGRPVHAGRTVNEVLLAAMTATAPPLASAAADVHPSICAVVDGALAPTREARWSDAAAMQVAVRRAYEDSRGAPIQTAPRLTVPDVALRTNAPSSAPTTATGVTAAAAARARTTFGGGAARRLLPAAAFVTFGGTSSLPCSAARAARRDRWRVRSRRRVRMPRAPTRRP